MTNPAWKEFPPHDLRFKVHGTRDPESFKIIGNICARDIERALERTGHPLSPGQKFLDLGCGCGRVLAYLLPEQPQVEFHGCENDRAAASWCEGNIPGVGFTLTEPDPPTVYEDAQFDVVIMISVLTHQDEERGKRWVTEARRILKKNGVLIATFHGPSVWMHFPDKSAVAHMEKHGFTFGAGGMWKGIFPDWYGTSYHSEGYVRDTLSKGFKVLEYKHRGLNNHQDMLVAEREL